MPEIMCRIHFSFILLFVLLVLKGQVVPIEIEQQVAENFNLEACLNMTKGTSEKTMRYIQTVHYEGIPLYHVCNADDNQGFVLVAGNYNFYPVAGHSPECFFDVDDLPLHSRQFITRESPFQSVARGKRVWRAYT